MDMVLLSVLACPTCGGKLLYDQQDQKLVCHFEQKAFSAQFGIPLLKQDQACAL